MNLSQEIVAFANGNTDFYVAFADYHNHKAAEEWGKTFGSYDKNVGGVTFGIAVATLLIIGILAWRGGRTWCNTLCPVGTVLGFVSRFSWLKPVIDTSKCNGCGLCARNCKAACINSKEHNIDYSRCVACMDCIEHCKKGAISYVHRSSEPLHVQVWS